MSIPITATAAAQGEGMKRHSRHWSRLPEIAAPHPAQALAAAVLSGLLLLLGVAGGGHAARQYSPRRRRSVVNILSSPAERPASSQLLNTGAGAGSEDAPVSEQCPSCGAQMAADQRYCLECGLRRGDPRLPFMDAVVFMDAIKRPGRGRRSPPPPRPSAARG